MITFLKKITVVSAATLFLLTSSHLVSSLKKTTSTKESVHFATIFKSDDVNSLAKALEGKTKKEVNELLDAEQALEKKPIKFCILNNASKCLNYLRCYFFKKWTVADETIEELIKNNDRSMLLYLIKTGNPSKEEFPLNIILKVLHSVPARSYLDRLSILEKLEKRSQEEDNELYELKKKQHQVSVFKQYTLDRISTLEKLKNPSEKEKQELSELKNPLVTGTDCPFQTVYLPTSLGGNGDLSTLDLLLSNYPTELKQITFADRKTNVPSSILSLLLQSPLPKSERVDKFQQTLVIIHHLVTRFNLEELLTQVTDYKGGKSSFIGFLAQMENLDQHILYSGDNRKTLFIDLMNKLEQNKARIKELALTPVGKSSSAKSPLVLAAKNKNFVFLAFMLSWFDSLKGLKDSIKKTLEKKLTVKRSDNEETKKLKELLANALKDDNNLKDIKQTVGQLKEEASKENEHKEQILMNLISYEETEVLTKLLEATKKTNENEKENGYLEALKLAIEKGTDTLLVWMLSCSVLKKSYQDKLSKTYKNCSFKNNLTKEALTAANKENVFQDLINKNKSYLLHSLKNWQKAFPSLPWNQFQSSENEFNKLLETLQSTTSEQNPENEKFSTNLVSFNQPSNFTENSNKKSEMGEEQSENIVEEKNDDTSFFRANIFGSSNSNIHRNFLFDRKNPEMNEPHETEEPSDTNSSDEDEEEDNNPITNEEPSPEKNNNTHVTIFTNPLAVTAACIISLSVFYIFTHKILTENFLNLQSGGHFVKQSIKGLWEQVKPLYNTSTPILQLGPLASLTSNNKSLNVINEFVPKPSL